MTIGTVATWFFLWIAVSVVFGLGLGQWMQTQAEEGQGEAHPDHWTSESRGASRW